MMKLNLVDDNLFNNGFHERPLSFSSLGDVNYSCGSCGYELNLNSCNRNASVIGSKGYGKSIKRGIISFYSIDETRFTRIEQLRCKPYFSSTRSWGLFQTRTKLLCRKCGNYLGNAAVAVVAAAAYQRELESGVVSSSCSLNYSSIMRKESPVSACSSLSSSKSASASTSTSWGWDGMSGAAMYDIKIRALQPSSCRGSNTIDMIG